MTKEERIAIQEQRLTEMTAFERDARLAGHTFIGGCDEAGRGPLAGPVVAACVVLPRDFHVLGVDDSKKLTPKKRDELFDLINGEALAVGVGSSDNRVIDEINILNATKESFREAVRNADASLAERCGGHIDFLIFDAVSIPDLGIEQVSPVKGDSRSVSTAAASIIAKVTRDRLMAEFDEIYPGYGFAGHKGYGTKAHYEAIKKYGATPIHRLSFLKNLDEH